MRIQPIVEGHGDESAVPILLRRLAESASFHEIRVEKPIRRKRHELVRRDPLIRAVELALMREGCGGIVILFDADDDCPGELGPKVLEWASAAARGVRCAVALANREYEAWFLASVESIRGRRGLRVDAAYGGDPELRRGAKEAIEDLMEEGSSYSETTDQAAFTARLDLARAYARSRSFRHLADAFTSILGCPVWPPAGWLG